MNSLVQFGDAGYSQGTWRTFSIFENKLSSSSHPECIKSPLFWPWPGAEYLMAQIADWIVLLVLQEMQKAWNDNGFFDVFVQCSCCWRTGRVVYPHFQGIPNTWRKQDTISGFCILQHLRVFEWRHIVKRVVPLNDHLHTATAPFSYSRPFSPAPKLLYKDHFSLLSSMVAVQYSKTVTRKTRFVENFIQLEHWNLHHLLKIENNSSVVLRIPTFCYNIIVETATCSLISSVSHVLPFWWALKQTEHVAILVFFRGGLGDNILRNNGLMFLNEALIHFRDCWTNADILY